ncbi:putative DNA-binding domain-containing protein [Pseudoxanthomonas sp. z9]|uniref:HvfC family RiPP maturation protein n=1 Tax=Pseudoxanthomonas sp. z9 TaxID=2584942 RepID=UPI0011436897|nr:putative DNA-binding domain-containing protein [Pseudoxanthomonas sp. z9]
MAEHLREQQFAFARHLRDPQRHPAPPGIEDRRMAIYRDLFFNNIQGLLAGNFPVIRQTLGDADWRALVRDFYALHRSRTPLFPEVAREFIRFLQDHPVREDAPWLAELAHYEWVELALQISDEPAPHHDPDGDLLDGMPVTSPWAWALAYQWPVPRIGPEYRPLVLPETPTLLLVRRDMDHAIRFADLSPLVYRLFELLGEHRLSGRQALQQLAAEAGVPGDDDFIARGETMLVRMRREGSLLGTALPG